LPTAKVRACHPGELNWLRYYSYTNALFRGREKCECHRNSARNLYTENRIYINAITNTTLAYFQWFGDSHLPHGWDDKLFQGTFKSYQSSCPTGYLPNSNKDRAWKSSVATFLRTTVPRLKPTHLFLQAGWWPLKRFDKNAWIEIARAGSEAVSSTRGKFVWRTTPTSLSTMQNLIKKGKLKAVGERYSHGVDVTLLLQNGVTHLHNSDCIIQYFEKRNGESSTFVDKRHLSARANVALARDMMSELIC